LRGDPRGKLESDVIMGIGAAVSARFGDDPFRMCFFNPLFYRENKSV
jgi:hypothetical protein